MKKYFLLINVIVGFSCNQTLKQQEVIPVSKMVELLVDIHILEARVDKLRLSNDSSYTIYNTLEKEIYTKYEVTKVEYDNSYQYYLSNPKMLDQIYGVVVDSLNVIQKRGYQEDSELPESADEMPDEEPELKISDGIGKMSVSRDSLKKR